MKTNFAKKISAVMLLSVAFTSIQCSTDDSSPIDVGGGNTYSNYDFYVAHKGCGQIDEFTKNFQPIEGYDKSVNFNVFGINLYSFGLKKYRNTPSTAPTYIPGSNFSGFVSKNGIEIYSDLGGISNAVIGVQEVNTDIYFATGYRSLEGGMDVSQANQVLPDTKIYKNGTIINTLSSPFNNWYYNTSGGIVNNYKSLLSVYDIIAKGNDIFISGSCYNLHGNTRSYGYWKNGIYQEVYLASPNQLLSGFGLKLIVKEDGNLFYGLQYQGTRLFKNHAPLINGTIEDTAFKDFDVLNDDVYLLGVYFQSGNNYSGYYFGIYKNGMLEYNCPISSKDDNFKIQVVDNKIFICGHGIESDDKMSVFEYKTATKTLVKVGSTSDDYSCGYVQILNFKVIKK